MRGVPGLGESFLQIFRCLAIVFDEKIFIGSLYAVSASWADIESMGLTTHVRRKLRQQAMGPAAAGTDTDTDKRAGSVSIRCSRPRGMGRKRRSRDGLSLGDRQGDEAATIVARHLDEHGLAAGLGRLGDGLLEIRRAGDFLRVHRNE